MIHNRYPFAVSFKNCHFIGMHTVIAVDVYRHKPVNKKSEQENAVYNYRCPAYFFRHFHFFKPFRFYTISRQNLRF